MAPFVLFMCFTAHQGRLPQQGIPPRMSHTKCTLTGQLRICRLDRR